MKLCLLAAGFAKRMYPLTRDRAKPLLEVGGSPMLSRLLEQALATGAIDEAAVVLASRFEQEFEAWKSTLDVPITLLANGAHEDSEARGAVADLALLLRECFPNGSPDGYLVMAGDNLLRFDLAEPLAMFREASSTPLLSVRPVPEPIPPGKYSEVVVDQETREVLSFREKPQDPESPWSAIGFYFLPPDLPELVGTYLEQGGEADAPGHFLVWLCQERRCRAWGVPNEGWFDVGSLEGLEEARAIAARSQD
ncbi:MAG: sugar phosphate nucleotidyltransferase [Planctomycetota bacterium]